MRVPQYTSQTQRSADVGARETGVRIDPNAATAGLKATVGLTKVATDIALDYFEKEMNLRNEKDDLEAQSKLIEHDRKLQYAIQKFILDPDKKLAAYQNGFNDPNTGEFLPGMKAFKNTAANGIRSRSTKQNFLGVTAANLVLKGTDNVRTAARKLEVDQYKAAYVRNKNLLMKQWASGDEAARDKLLGYTMADGTVVPGLIDKARGLGALDFEQAEKERIDVAERSARLRANDIMQAAIQSGSPGAIRAALAKVSNPSDPELIDLRPEDRDRLATRLIRMEDTAISRGIAAANAADRRSDRQQKKLQTLQRGQYQRMIDAHNLNPDENPMPSINQLTDTFESGGLDNDGYVYLRDQILGKDAPASDSEFMIEITGQVLDARTDEELDEINQRIDQKASANELTQKDYRSLRNLSSNRTSSLGGESEIDFFQKRVKQLVGADPRSKLSQQFGEKDFFVNLQLDAEVLYRDMVNDPVNPVPPRVAFERIKESFKSAVNNELNKLPVIDLNRNITSPLGLNFGVRGIDQISTERLEDYAAILKDSKTIALQTGESRNFTLKELQREIENVNYILNFRRLIEGADDLGGGQIDPSRQ